MGEGDFYMILLPLILWCVDFGAGTRLAVIFLFSVYANGHDLVDQSDLFRLVGFNDFAGEDQFACLCYPNNFGQIIGRAILRNESHTAKI